MKTLTSRVKIGNCTYLIPAAEPVVRGNIGRPKIKGESGMGLTEFLMELFIRNEQLHLTDKQLEFILLEEFKNQPKVLKALTKPSCVSAYRSKYNNREYGEITVLSFRYDDKKQPLRRGCKSNLTFDEQKALVIARKVADKRFVKPPRKPARKSL